MFTVHYKQQQQRQEQQQEKKTERKVSKRAQGSYQTLFEEKKIINILMNDVKIFPKRTKTKNNNKVTNNRKIFLKMKRKAS